MAYAHKSYAGGHVKTILQNLVTQFLVQIETIEFIELCNRLNFFVIEKKTAELLKLMTVIDRNESKFIVNCKQNCCKIKAVSWK